MCGLKFIIVILSSFLRYGDCARILGIVPTPSYSHQVAFQTIFKELSLRGHQVTTVTTNPLKDSALTNLTEIDLQSSYDIWNKEASKITSHNIINLLFSVLDLMEAVGHHQLSHPQVQDLINTKTKEFDVVMVEYTMLPMFAFAKKFNVPLIVLTSIDAISDVREFMGSPTHPIIYPDPIIPLKQHSTLTERVLLVSLKLFFCVFNRYVLSNQQVMLDKYFGTNYPPAEELTKDISLVLANSDPIFHGIKPLVPTIVLFGGGTHRTPPKPLPSELKKILDEAKNGFIYFSLGSNMKSKDLSETTRETILEVFREIPYTILWKFENDDLPNKPKNVMIFKWLPQQDVLSKFSNKHPNIKLFITQCGLQSMDEAIYDHVPMLGMPFFGDQEFNVRKMEKMGFGLYINHKTMTKEELKAAILEIIENPKFKNTIKKLSSLAQDRPMTGLQNAVWWTEYVIRHNGTKHLRSPLLDIPLYQYYLLDVIAVFVLVFIVLLCAIIFIYLRPSYDIWNKYIADLSAGSMLQLLIAIQEIFFEIAHYQLSHPKVQRLLNSDSKEFDLVMVEYSLIPMQAFAKKFNAPLVIMSSMDIFSDMRYMMGCPSHPIAHRDPFVPADKDTTLLQRIIIIFFIIFNTIMQYFHFYPNQQLIIDQYFGKNYATIQELNEDISLVLGNSNPIFNGVKPLLPTIVQFGGGTHRTAPKPLPTDLKKSLDEAKMDSFILVWDLTSKTFQELPYTVLWKFELDDLPNKPKNVITRKWMQQQDILRHPNIKLFITQGGLQSAEEAIYDHVPMLGIPFFGDQDANVANMVSMGFGLSIDYRTINKEEFKSAIFEVINNPKYKKTIKKLAELALDEPMTGLEKAIWWTEYVIRHNGTKHLRSPMLDIPFYQYYLLDVIGVFVVVLGGLILTIIISIKLLLKIMRKKKLKAS
ncbi:hypothetical protein FQR65_LT00897 [Abscondita terminalis]|nr:hypothetical protein FQR65_LT00897 [Abscondita terminalis]